MELLFCFGLPKSGTTFLQMALNSHPEVACPSEHMVRSLHAELKQLIGRYNATLRQIDERTANQGTHPFLEDDDEHFLKAIVERAALRGAGRKAVRWHGIKDNSILSDLAAYMRIFERAKFVCIVRDPRAVALSAWHHNLRVEEGFLARARSIEDWALVCGKAWQQNMSAVMAQQRSSRSGDRLIVCKYEDFILRPETTLAKLFGFLGVDASGRVVASVTGETRFENWQDGEFFRRADPGEWRDGLSASAICNVETSARAVMEAFGY